MVSISACHAEDPGSIPGRGASFFRLLSVFTNVQRNTHAHNTLTVSVLCACAFLQTASHAKSKQILQLLSDKFSYGTYFRTFVLLKKVLNLILYKKFSFCFEILQFQCDFVLRLSKARKLVSTNRFQVAGTGFKSKVTSRRNFILKVQRYKTAVRKKRKRKRKKLCKDKKI